MTRMRPNQMPGEVFDGFMKWHNESMATGNADHNYLLSAISSWKGWVTGVSLKNTGPNAYFNVEIDKPKGEPKDTRRWFDPPALFAIGVHCIVGGRIDIKTSNDGKYHLRLRLPFTKTDKTLFLTITRIVAGADPEIMVNDPKPDFHDLRRKNLTLILPQETHPPGRRRRSMLGRPEAIQRTLLLVRDWPERLPSGANAELVAEMLRHAYELLDRLPLGTKGGRLLSIASAAE